MVDIHTHIIFDVDDGSDTLDESIAILRQASRSGVTDIICTPHYIDGVNYDKEKVVRNFEKLKNETKFQDIPINLYLGNEVIVYGNIIDTLEDERVDTLAGSKYMLIEFPMNSDVSYISDTIYEMKLKGITPIIAHPERCECFRKHYDRIREAIEEGAYIQCNTGSLLGKYGKTAVKIVKKMLKDNLVHFFATDTHSVDNLRYVNLPKVESELEKLVGKDEMNKLLAYNARKILVNEDIESEEE